MIKSMRIVKLPKRLRYRSPLTRAYVNHMGNAIANRIERRIKRRGVDGEGKKLPPLADTGKVIVSQGDKVMGRLAKNRKSGYVADSYKEAKAKLTGRSPNRDGSLSGAMWESIVIAFSRNKKGGWITIKFSKKDKNKKYYTGKITKTGKRSTRSFGNRDKATLMMRKGGRYGGRVMFELMSMAPREIMQIADDVLARIRLL